MLNSTEHEIHHSDINLKMATIVGILTFISMIKPTYESLKVNNIFQHFSCYKQLQKIMPSWVEYKKTYNLRAKFILMSLKHQKKRKGTNELEISG